jgi:hypothetical protein
VIHGEERLAVPYLPDPLASGVVLFGLPGVPADEPFIVRYGGSSWDAPSPLRLRLAEPDDAGSITPHWDHATGVLTVRLAKGERQTVRIASCVDDYDTMAMLRWCNASSGPQATPILPAEAYERIREAMENHRHWMFTPWHEVALVHAVQRPLFDPEIGALSAYNRGRGRTDAELSGSIAVHDSSTERIELIATWSERVDTPLVGGAAAAPATGYTEVHHDAIALTMPIADARRAGTIAGGRLEFDTTNTRTPLTPQQFGDTKHRRVTYRAVASSAFREYFPPSYAVSPQTLTTPGLPPYPDALTRVGQPVVLDVPSSAPPPPPKVLYAVPTLGWSSSPDAPSVTVTRTRRGGGIRVYLDRPWYVSGDGELLGVVIGDPSSREGADPGYPYVTHLGGDPVRRAGDAPLLDAGSMRNAAHVTQLRDDPILANATIFGYEPSFDSAAERWCCDIDIDTGSAYFPFVRLALVRYQPHALEGCHLSPVTVVDSVQTLPDRFLTVTREADAHASVTLRGPTYAAVADHTGEISEPSALAAVSAQFERRDPAVLDDLLGWEAIGSEIPLVAGTPVDGVMTWSVRTPIPPEADSAILSRLVVIEHDRLPADSEPSPTTEFASRIVYADGVDLSVLVLDLKRLLDIVDSWSSQAYAFHGQQQLEPQRAAAQRAYELCLRISTALAAKPSLTPTEKKVREDLPEKIRGVIPLVPQDMIGEAVTNAEALFEALKSDYGTVGVARVRATAVMAYWPDRTAEATAAAESALEAWSPLADAISKAFPTMSPESGYKRVAEIAEALRALFGYLAKDEAHKAHRAAKLAVGLWSPSVLKSHPVDRVSLASCYMLDARLYKREKDEKAATRAATQAAKHLADLVEILTKDPQPLAQLTSDRRKSYHQLVTAMVNWTELLPDGDAAAKAANVSSKLLAFLG